LENYIATGDWQYPK